MPKLVENLTLEEVIHCARLHGEADDPDHEVGDLQDLCRLMRKHMTDGQWKALAATKEFAEVVSGAGGYDDRDPDRITTDALDDVCRECGEPCFVTDDGVSHHTDADGNIDHDQDADHAPIPEGEE